MRPSFHLGIIQCPHQRRIQRPQQQRGFSRPRHTGQRHKLPQRKFHIYIFQVMPARTVHSNRFSVTLATFFRHFYLFFA